MSRPLGSASKTRLIAVVLLRKTQQLLTAALLYQGQEGNTWSKIELPSVPFDLAACAAAEK